MNKIITFTLTAIGMGILVSSSFFSCKKPPTMGKVIVLDTMGDAVPNCRVKILCVPGQQPICTIPDGREEPEDSMDTDASGRVTFGEFELPAVLKVEAYRDFDVLYDTFYFDDEFSMPDTAYDTTIIEPYFGEGWLILEEHETVETEIHIFPADD